MASSSQTKRQECINDLIKTARSSKFSSLRKLATNEQEIYNVWDSISQLVENNMEQRKAVQIPGLGVFTFTSSKLDVGHNKFILIQRPVFILSERLARTHRLTQSKYHVPGEIPVIQLNYTALAIENNVPRDLVEASVKEVVNTLSRAIDKIGTCEFAFTTIGNLVISSGAAKMKFLPMFLERMDHTGYLTKFLTQRPGTSSSVLSNNSLLLPRIQPGENVKSFTSKSPEMTCIKEEEGEDLPPSQSPKKEKEILTPTLKVESRTPRIQQLTLPHEHQAPKPSTPYNPTTPKKSPPHLKRTMVTFKDPRSEIESKQQTRVFPSPRTSQMEILNQLKKAPKMPEDNRCTSCVESMNDFCYLCYQREQRNVPVYYTEERKQEEQEEDYLLQMYTMLKDTESQEKEEELNTKKRDDAQQIARFNLGVSESLKEKKDERIDKFQRSFVFRNRPVTPPHFITQENYQTDLAKQVSDKTKQANRSRKNNENLERLEQLELAQDLALQRDHYLKSKRLQSDEYRKALDTQVYIKQCLEERYQESNRRFVLPRPNVVMPFESISLKNRSNSIDMVAFKPSELPAAYPDSEGPVFGINDTNNETRKDYRKRAKKLYTNQLTMACEKKKYESNRNSKQRREEEDMLRKTKVDLLQETLIRNQLHLKQRQDLEKTWAQQAFKKRNKEIDDKLRARSPGLLLHEQCNKYSRCEQCTRHQRNSGQSNVWSDSRYVSGSRLMV